jgi:aerobic carbon-monoxide dehydrogenase small subunit
MRAAAVAAAQDSEVASVQTITLTVNGVEHSVDVEPRRLLVHVLREDLGLTGTHIGCDTSSCGACTIHVDGDAVLSCTILAVQADGSEIRTVEGLASAGGLHPIQQAFHEQHALQCGFCTPGMMMAAIGLIEAADGPLAEAEIRAGLEGNLCRCTGYQNIVRAIEQASREMARV